MGTANVIDVPDAEVATDRWRISRAVRFTLVVLLALVAFDALHEIFGLAGSGAAAFAAGTAGTAGTAAGYSNLIDSWFYDVAATGAGILMLVHALSDRDERGWILLALGTFSWVIGDLLAYWRIASDLGGVAEGVSASDLFWLA